MNETNKSMISEEYKDEEGKFFRTYITKVQDSLTKEQFITFSNLKTDEDRIKFVYDLNILHELELPKFAFGKNVQKALDYKNKGNKLYGQSQFGIASKSYWLGLLECPPEDGVLLATLHANRSACLYNMQEYHQALHDIATALSLPYPNNLHHKVHERKARCCMALHDIKNAVDAFKHALTGLDESGLNATVRQKKATDFSIMIELLTKTLAKGGEKKKTEAVSPLPIVPELTKGKNEQYPSASNAVAFSVSETEGRFAVANEDIDAGEVILVEKSHCATLIFQYAKTHCQQCFCRVSNPFPCLGCTTVVFCSPKCRRIAMNSYHKYECKFLGALLTEGASIICCLAVRLITQKGIEYFLDIKSKLEKDPGIGKAYDPSDYKTIYNLCTHGNLRSANDFFQRATMSTILLRFLQNANFFSKLPAKDLTEPELFIGSLLLHNLQLLQFNAHEISELQFSIETPGDISKSNSTFIGGGLFPTLALFNHSCEPGIVRYFSGSKIIVRTVKPVASGEIIAENYGPIYTQASRDTRKLELKTRYWFDCNCVPCSENWPVFDDMKTDILPFKCNKTDYCRGFVKVMTNTEEFMFKCPKCKEMICIFAGLRNLNDTEGMFSQGERLIAEHRYQDSLNVFLRVIKILNNNLKAPYKDLCLCQQKIRSNMLTLGNCYQLKTIKQV